MITVNIAHYNRPYFLDLNVSLLRKFMENNIRIVVADDGSPSNVVERIKKLPIDDIYVNPNHKSSKKGSGSFAETMRKSVSLCKTDYYMFLEDDFIYLKCPVPAGIEHLPTFSDPVPDVPFNTDSKNVFDTAISLFEKDSRVGIVKMQLSNRIYKRFKTKKSTKITLDEFEFYNTEIKSAIVNSWPYVIRKNVADASQSKSPLNVWSRQRHIKKSLQELLVGKGSMIVYPGRFLHVGNGVSVNVTASSTDKIRKNMSNHLQSSFGSMYRDYTKFCEFLSSKYCTGRFFFDISEVEEKGIKSAFVSAFERLR